MAETIKIALTGDIMLGRLVNDAISLYGYKYPWGNVLPLLQKNDFNLINLETTLTKSNQAVPKIFNFKAEPDKVQCLVEANIQVVNLANNHILDFGEEGLTETIATLDQAGILHLGAGQNKKEARQPAIVQKKGIRIGIVGYQNNEPSWEATETKAGIAYVEVGNRKYLQEIIQEIKELKKKVDLLIFTIHWGPNMRERPSKSFIEFAHALIDAGVDIFHGHSAHLVQGIEIYKQKLIIYDSGDFVDDYAVDTELRNDWSFLFLVKVNKKGIQKVELIPVFIEHMQVNIAEGEVRRQIIERMRKLSAEFGTKMEEKEGKAIVVAENRKE